MACLQARVRDALYHEDPVRNSPEPSAPPYTESDPHSQPADLQGGEGPEQLLNSVRSREEVFVRRDEAGREWIWNGERLIVSNIGEAM